MTWLLHQNVVFLVFLAGLFTWGCTIVGSGNLGAYGWLCSHDGYGCGLGIND